MIKFLMIITLALSVFSINAKSTDTINVSTAVNPEFPGGDAALAQYISSTFQYPEMAREMGEQGTVYVRFTVSRNGEIEAVEVVKSVSTSIDEEAVRVVKNMPRWIPGQLKGKPVDVQFTIPIRARLGEEVEYQTEPNFTAVFNFAILLFGAILNLFGAHWLLNRLSKIKRKSLVFMLVTVLLALIVIAYLTNFYTIKMSWFEFLAAFVTMFVFSGFGFLVSPIDQQTKML